jgi:uncharacterized protein (DUF1800 family)
MSHQDRRSFLMPHRRPKQSHIRLRSEFITEQPAGMERLEALRAARLAAPPLSGLAPYSGPWTREEVIHLLRRTMFGATRADVDYFAGLTMEQSVNELLNAPYVQPDPPVNDYNSADFTDPDVPFGETWVDAFYSNDGEGYRVESLRAWWLRQMMGNNRSIREKMTLFWHNHMPVLFSDVFSGGHLYRYQRTLRENALGNFKTMMRAITLDPAMLYFLNGYVNSVYAPDENYAREIQELFVIGKDLPQYYTEDDVKEAARLLTGWRLSPSGFGMYFNPNEHDKQDKQFSAFYGNKLIQGQTGINGGGAELDAFLDMLFEHPEAARFICRKIYRFFIYHDIDAQTEQNVIVPLAQILRDNQYELLPTLEVLFKSEHFFDVLNRGAVIKSPIEMVITFFRQMGVTLPGAADLTDTFFISYITNYVLSEMSQIPGDPPNVAGWQAYYQKPALDKLWINSSTLPKRGQITEYMLFVGLAGANNVAVADVLGFAASTSDPSEPDILIEEAHQLLFGLPVSNTVRDYHKAVLLNNLPSAYYWTVAWGAYENNPTDPIIKGEVENRLKFLFHFMTQREEYQLM